MLIKVAGHQRLERTFGPMGALFIEGYEHGTEIRYKEQRVLFFDATGNWMVGFTFNDIILAAALGTPEQFYAEVRWWLTRTKAGDTPPQLAGKRW
jgi:hydrogenase/urease accessory protein HupE